MSKPEPLKTVEHGLHGFLVGKIPETVNGLGGSADISSLVVRTLKQVQEFTILQLIAEFDLSDSDTPDQNMGRPLSLCIISANNFASYPGRPDESWQDVTEEVSVLPFQNELQKCVSSCKAYEWMAMPGIAEILYLNACVFGQQERNFGGILSATHPIDVATYTYWMCKNEGKSSTFTMQAVYLALLHDSIEDFCSAGGQRTSGSDQQISEAINHIVEQYCFKNLNEQKRTIQQQQLKQQLMALTDSLDCRGRDRAHEQISRAKGRCDDPALRYSAEASMVRMADKMVSLLRDLNCLKQRTLPPNAVYGIVGKYASRKWRLVECLRVPPIYKKLYQMAIVEIFKTGPQNLYQMAKAICNKVSRMYELRPALRRLPREVCPFFSG